MNGVTVSTLCAMLLQLALGLAVFQANRHRLANQCFLLLSVIIAAWLGSLFLAFIANTPGLAEFAIRQASATGALYLATLNLLRLSVRQREQGWRAVFRHSRVWLVLTFGIVWLCQTKVFLQGAQLSATGAAPSPIYGPAAYFYGAFFILAFPSLIVSYWRDLRTTTGGERAELAFILIGAVSGVALWILVGQVLSFFVGPSRAILLAPFRVVVISLVMAYGIATRKIMEVGFFLRRVMSYVVLAAYLLILYGIVWWLFLTVAFPVFGPNSQSLAHVVAAIIVAFAMAPARGFSQTLADRLFVGTRRMDFRTTMSRAANILKSVSTLRDLLERFAMTTAEAVGTERVSILLLQRQSYVEHFPARSAAQERLQLDISHPVIGHLAAQPEPLVFDELHRVRSTPELQLVIDEMEKLHAAAIIGIFSRDHLAGVMLLGPRTSGRIYGNVEQNALQVLCGQLAVAIDNAQLFTEVQNAKIYNEILLQNLTTGVIAADREGRITVFNKEAEQITELPWQHGVDRSIEDLPAPLRALLGDTLRSGELQENREVILRSEERNVVARASSSIFHGQEGELLGALMVLTDITALKHLELQVRRSDRLASLGTLSAGMAHEIKNPLVSIKTFAQLLPERYQDSDFRETFSNLIGHEIDRIDSLVNQLLRFARPAKPLLKPMHAHEVLEKSLMLVGHRFYQKEIKISRSWNADVDTIRADADQLEQVFLNFFLNAMDAMKAGGELKVGTEIRPAEEWVLRLRNGANDEAQEVLRITVRDDGAGIRREDIPHVFDPFFTTKDYGTGLGLSVVHGIVQEHGGQIEVESELCKGTAFHILLPLVRFEEEVAAA